jgi:excisionase family DNA binding protein
VGQGDFSQSVVYLCFRVKAEVLERSHGHSPHEPRPFEPGKYSNGPALSVAVPTQLLDLIAKRAAELIERPAAEADPWLTVEQAAGYLACKPKRIYDLCSQRRVPFAKDGSRTLLRRTDLDAYLEGSS